MAELSEIKNVRLFEKYPEKIWDGGEIWGYIGVCEAWDVRAELFNDAMDIYPKLYIDMGKASFEKPFPKTKLANAKKSYANSLGFSESETIFFLIDTTLFGSVDEGAIFTDEKIYIKNLWEDPIVIKYEDLRRISVSEKEEKIIFYDYNDKEYVLSSWSGTSNYLFRLSLTQFILKYAFLLRLDKEGGEIKTESDWEAFELSILLLIAP
ncbi:hypothetical protein [Rodentibacter myodis]|uniref:Uncharacterized protein n=1 Tax=Rodentibacter myodis TaxID=1907939 RepID=A0A1V3JMF5_9PAST|nr:hypothetical protein [Rodentibacter myodis]OOF57567.1 hypothetical protein BKL49_08775 [Rodentibacter myodis]